MAAVQMTASGRTKKPARSWRRNLKGGTARRAVLYSSAYKLALEQITTRQMREQPDISLRLHASIRRQLKAGEIDPHAIAFAALKDAGFHAL